MVLSNVLYSHLVLEMACAGFWCNRRWVINRRDHLSNHDRAFDPSGRISLDYAHLCFPHISSNGEPLQTKIELAGHSNNSQIVANLTVKSRIPPHPKPLVLMEFITPLTELPFALLTLGSFLIFLGMFIPINFIILQALEQGMSQHLANYLISILNALRYV
jgi:hypothetical protein